MTSFCTVISNMQNREEEGEEEEATLGDEHGSPYSGDRGADTSKEHMEEYVRIGRSTEAVCSEHKPVVALEVFPGDHTRLERPDPFAT